MNDTESKVNVTVRLTPSDVARIDALAKQRSSGGLRASRASLVEDWIARALKDAARVR